MQQRIKTHQIIGIAFLVMSLLTGCGHMEKRSDILVKMPLEAIEQKRHFQKIWSAHLAQGVGRDAPEILLSRMKDTLITADATGKVIALNRFNGKPIWVQNLKATLSSGPSVAQGKVLVGTRDAKVYALEAETGQVLWENSVDAEVLAEIAIGKDFAFVHTLNGGLSALNIENGRQFWRYSLTPPPLMLRRAAKPLLLDQMVVGGFSNGHLVALNRFEGSLLWENKVSLPKGREDIQRMVDLSANPIYQQGRIYAISFQGNLGAYSEHTGELLWEKSISAYSSMTLSGAHLYISDATGALWCLQAHNGETLWKQSDLYGRKLSQPVLLQDMVIVADDDGFLHCLSQKTGEFVARFQATKNRIEAAPIVIGDTLYALDYRGYIFSYRLIG